MHEFAEPITAHNLNELTYKACHSLIKNGNKEPSRNGTVIEICDQDLYLHNPRSRHLYLHGRKNNIFATIAETFWVLSGRDHIYPGLSFFIPRADNFSDDGITWRAAYGPRLYDNRELEHVVEMFSVDGIATRRAVISIWQSQSDTISRIRDKGIADTRDMPCSNWLGFWVRNNKLYCKLQMRSNDCIWGFSNINLFEFTVLQELVLLMLQKDHPNLELGYYHHSAASLHLYDPGTASQAVEIVNSSLKNMGNMSNYNTFCMDIGCISNVGMLRGLMKVIWSHYECLVSRQTFLVDFDNMFASYGMPLKNNLLYGYAKLVEQYICSKIPSLQDKCILNPSTFPEFSKDFLGEDLKNAVVFNSFTPSNWLE